MQSPHSSPPDALGKLPAHVEAAIWRANAVGASPASVVPTGWPTLDAELPGGGWPCNAVTELLQAQSTVAEWRLLGPALRQLQGRSVVLIGPAKRPHVPGLQQYGVDERQLVWVCAETPAERLWVTEQLIRANGGGLILAWLPQARQEQLRRLQLAAQAGDGLVVLCRPTTAAHDPSPAPLRVTVEVGLDWTLSVRVVKRRGAVHDRALELLSVPASLSELVTPRLRLPSALRGTLPSTPARSDHVVVDALGRVAARPTAGLVS